MPLFIQNKTLAASKKNCSFRFLSHSPSSRLVCFFSLFHPSGVMILCGEYKAVVLLGKAHVQSTLGLFLVEMQVPLQPLWGLSSSLLLPWWCYRTARAVSDSWILGKAAPTDVLFLTCPRFQVAGPRFALHKELGFGVSGDSPGAMVLWSNACINQ